MARGSTQAIGAAESAQKLSDSYAGNAGGLFATLAPMLQSQAAAPPGMSPADIADADTAAMDAGGGSMAGATGTGLLRAARTRNAGGADAAIAEAARAASQGVAQAGVGTRLKNATLKEGQRSDAIRGLGGLYSDTSGSGVRALGIVPESVNANTQAVNASWDWAKDLLSPLLGAAGTGTGAYLGARAGVRLGG